MSEKTLADLNAAISAHIADENPGDFAGDWAFVAHVISFSDVPGRGYYTTESSGLAPHAQHGLLNIGLDMSLESIDGDDEE